MQDFAALGASLRQIVEMWACKSPTAIWTMGLVLQAVLGSSILHYVVVRTSHPGMLPLGYKTIVAQTLQNSQV